MATPIRAGVRKDYEDVTTRMPAEVLVDLKHRLAPRYGGTLTAMYDVMLKQFLADKPWEVGLRWRETQALSRREETVKEVRAGDGSTLTVPVTKTVATGWVQVNMRLEPNLAARVRSVAAANGVSPSTVLYTAVYYWIWYKNPTPEILALRKKRFEQYKKRIEAEQRDAAEQAAEQVLGRVMGKSAGA